VSDEVILTVEGLNRIMEELDYLKGKKRREVAQRIKRALEFGDISENSEYIDAKNEQAFVEGRIALLEKLLRNASLIDDENIRTDVVGVGTTVKIKDLDFDEECQYTIVGSAEANPSANRISNESPVGKGLLGKSPGEVVEISVPAGVARYRIIEVSK
jgi:transcription elongation factor GreA